MTPIRMSKIEGPMRTVLDFNDAFNRHDVAGMMGLMSEDCIFENTSPAPDGTVYKGKAAVTDFWEEFFRNSPQAHIQVEDLIGYRDRCIMLWRYSWLDLEGIEGHVRGVDIYRFKDGLISEKLSYVKG
jgi:predicted SnoaL-like aldol condensation-catalyzing enzyme